MIIRLVLAGVWLGGASLYAQGESPMLPKEDALEQLLSERESLEALEKAVVEARALGITEQAILEARFLFHVDRNEDVEISALLPEFIRRKKIFKLSDSEIFANEEDWLAVTEYVQAIAALQRGENAAFKQHITEAFWLSPKQGAAFAPHIERMRLMDAMKDIRVDFSMKHISILTGDEVSLESILGEKKGLLLHFWSPLSQECEATLADFFITAADLLEKDMAVASILPETSDKVMEEAKKMLVETEKKIPGAWLVDTKQSPLGQRLKVQSVPVMVLLSANGHVLFNGHPTEDDFWEALGKLNPAIKRPDAREE
ncbi:MAG: thioredoxin family protein [Armatimonadetes bacterium]|nr:thioredoxin family protein [Akkermansiaceae bacterium]